MTRFLLLVTVGLLSACAHSVHDVYISDTGSSYSPLEKKNMVTAKSEQFVILGFVGQTDYVEQAKNNLVKQCPNGEITNIATQYSTSLGFFSWTNKVRMEGLCLDKKIANKN